MLLIFLPLYFTLSVHSFPVSDYFNSSDSLAAYYNKEDLLCSVESKCNLQGKFCSCHSHCWKHQTCCIDMLTWESMMNQSVTSSRGSQSRLKIRETSKLDWKMSKEAYLKRFLEKRKRFKPVSCAPVVSLSIPKQNPDYIQFIYKVITCPAGTEKQLDDKCTSTENIQEYHAPVVDSEGVIYKNSFCARCHGVLRVEFVNISAQCMSFNDVYSMLNVGTDFWECNYEIIDIEPAWYELLFVILDIL